MRFLCIAVMAWVVGLAFVHGAPAWFVFALSVLLGYAVGMEVRRYVLRRLRASQRAAWLSQAHCDVCAGPATMVWELSSSRTGRVRAQACPEHTAETFERFMAEIGR
jgi:hypothetical protein